MRLNFTRNLKSFILLFIVFQVAIAFSGQAQNAFELTWRTGEVILTSGDTVSGEITLRHPEDVVKVVRQDGSINAFSPVNVKVFDVMDEQNIGIFRSGSGPQQFRRTYQTLFWNHDKGYSNFKSPAFFVILKPGNYSLLMRETKERQYDNSNNAYAGQAVAVEKIEEQYYLLMPNQEIKSLRNPRKDLPNLFPTKSKEIIAYAREKGLSFTDPDELSKIVEYCNSLL
jgi:hypothetical protein